MRRRGGRGKVVLQATPTPLVDETAREVQHAFERFLKEFEAPNGIRPYLENIKAVVEANVIAAGPIEVEFRHIEQFMQELADHILLSFYRFEEYLKAGLNAVVRELRVSEGYQVPEAQDGHQELDVAIKGVQTMCKIREIRAEKIGSLMTISGTITRTSEVRPELLYGTFSCGLCNEIVRDIAQQFKYTCPAVCPNKLCANTKNWDLLIDQSKFGDWQKIRVQENSNEIPAGSMPRTIQVIVRNGMVEKAKPGDKCHFVGTPIVVPDVAQLSGCKVFAFACLTDTAQGAQSISRLEGRIGSNYEGVTGLKGLGVRDLSYKIAFLACSLTPVQARTGDFSIRGDDEQDIQDQFTEEDKLEVIALSKEPRIYSRFANCIAPSVYGHEEIKRGILLMLFGGVHKSTSDAGMGLRGDINICLVGDPAVAKSQFLKFVVSFLPRAVYTSGKASSAAGLTASVVRDSETGEFGIEAGALLLADNGICCIDEFDKMEPADQVAIHEAMEQQTISIAKAGIQATLNARASILAAANPIYGRYDPTKTLKKNINITAPIMSRFDLFYVVLDENHPEQDRMIANKIVSLHQGTHLELSRPEFSVPTLQKYIAMARTLKPKISEEAMKVLANHYTRMREQDVTGNSRSSYRITVRQLESIIRLSEALARVHLSPVIIPAYVNEAARLIRHSIVRVRSEDISLDDVDDTSFAKVRETDEGKEDTAMDIDQPQEGETGAEKDATASKLSISFEQYQRIANSLVLHIQHSTVPQSRSDLVNWFLKSRNEESEFTTPAELEYHQRLIKKVIKRLIERDGVLIESESSIVVHPNYDLNNDDALRTTSR